MATSLLSDRFSAHRFVDSSGFALPYRRLDPFTSRPITSLASPDPVPLVVLLHGAGERGDDNQAQLGNGAAELLATDERRAAFPCVYVLPQCPQGHRWVEVDWTAASHHLPPQPSQPLAALLALLDVLLTDSRIDARRMYLLGLSMGGFGVWDLLVRRPQLAAAAVTICGGGDEAQAALIAHVPIWTFHGEKDPVVAVSRSRNMVAALSQAGATPRYTEYPGVGHDAWWQVWAEPTLLPWLLTQQNQR